MTQFRATRESYDTKLNFIITEDSTCIHVKTSLFSLKVKERS